LGAESASFLSVSADTSFLISSFMSFIPSLKERMPFPNPRISSGIFFPPNNSKINSARMKNSDPWGSDKNNNVPIVDVLFSEVEAY